MSEDWKGAQVIEATTLLGRRCVYTKHGGIGWQKVGSGAYWGDADLSDVRVIVDHDGNVVPPPITDEMREQVKEAITDVLREHYGYVPFPCGRQATEAALTAALRGEQS